MPTSVRTKVPPRPTASGTPRSARPSTPAASAPRTTPSPSSRRGGHWYSPTGAGSERSPREEGAGDRRQLRHRPGDRHPAGRGGCRRRHQLRRPARGRRGDQGGDRARRRDLHEGDVGRRDAPDPRGSRRLTRGRGRRHVRADAARVRPDRLPDQQRGHPDRRRHRRTARRRLRQGPGGQPARGVPVQPAGDPALAGHRDARGDGERLQRAPGDPEATLRRLLGVQGRHGEPHAHAGAGVRRARDPGQQHRSRGDGHPDQPVLDRRPGQAGDGGEPHPDASRRNLGGDGRGDRVPLLRRDRLHHGSDDLRRRRTDPLPVVRDHLVLGMTALRPAPTVEERTAGWFPSRWGPDDQAGALNEITPATVLAAVSLVRTGAIHDLAHVLHADVPAFAGRTFRQYLTTNYHHINRRRPDGGPEGWGRNSVNWIVEQITATQQMGTHMDALNHLQVGDRAYNGHRLGDIAEDHGTNRLGVDTLPQIVTRGVLLDVAAVRGGERLGPGDVVTVADAEAALGDRSRRPGDAVLFHTGWGRWWGVDDDRYSSGEPGPGRDLAGWLARPPGAPPRGGPGPGRALAGWLARHRFALPGCDTWSYGPVPPEDPDEPFVVPQTLNVRHGIVVLENLRLAEAAAAGLREFCLVVSHAKLRGATGAWVTPLAIT